MRFGLPILAAASLLFAGGAICSASTITDTFGQVQNNCNYRASAPYSDCDVVGDPQVYDIQGISFANNGTTASLVITLNSGAVKKSGNTYGLSSFSDGGLTLIPGDIFFYPTDATYDPSDPTTTKNLKYGIALTSHGSFQAGGLYAIGGGVSVETAQQALNSQDYYRRNEVVLMTGSGTAISTGTVSVASNGGDGTTNAKYAITVTIPESAALLNLFLNNQMGILFSSADCGNDVIQGNVSSTTGVPEPGPMVLILTGIGFLLAGRRWRKPTA